MILIHIFSQAQIALDPFLHSRLRKLLDSSEHIANIKKFETIQNSNCFYNVEKFGLAKVVLENKCEGDKRNEIGKEIAMKISLAYLSQTFNVLCFAVGSVVCQELGDDTDEENYFEGQNDLQSCSAIFVESRSLLFGHVRVASGAFLVLAECCQPKVKVAGS